MKTTPHYKGHRWTTEELRELMRLWATGEEVPAIANVLNVTPFSVLKMVQKMRKNGIPLERRKKGHVAGRANQLWTQEEVSYLIRRRAEKATADEIGGELGRTPNSVHAMIGKLRSEDVPVAMMGSGVRRLWNPDALKAIAVQQPDAKVIEMTA